MWPKRKNRTEQTAMELHPVAATAGYDLETGRPPKAVPSFLGADCVRNGAGETV
jgi:hypothetical protein